MFTPLLIASTLLLGQDPWTVKDERSALDGSRSYLASVESVGTVNNAAGRPTHASLILSCVEGRQMVALSWPAYLGLDEVQVEWRAGDGEIRRSAFSVIRGGQTAWLGGREGDRLMSEIAASDQVVFRVTGHTTRSEAVFMTPGAGDQVARVKEACA